jgi:hypothetical protein
MVLKKRSVQVGKRKFWARFTNPVFFSINGPNAEIPTENGGWNEGKSNKVDENIKRFTSID